MENKFDFSGYATRNDLLCGDGRTIRKNAFKENDGTTVPLIWNHRHNDPDAVLGHALLENRDDGVYAYCKFNDTDAGKNAKKLVMHGDVRSLSIWANKLKQIGNDVIHGTIRELSLVLAGANPGATIDFVMAHGDEEEASVYVNYDESALVLYHSEKEDEPEESKEDNKETIKDIFDKFSDKEKDVVYYMIGQALKEASNKKSESSEKEDVKHSDETPAEEAKEEVKHSDETPAEEAKEEPKKEKTVQDVLDEFTEEQKKVVYALIGIALEDEDDVKHSDSSEEVEETAEGSEEGELAHSDKTVEDVLNEMTEEQQAVVYGLLNEVLEEKQKIKNDADVEGGNNNMKHNVFEQENNTVENNDVLTHSEMKEIIADAKKFGSLKESFLEHGIHDIEYLFPDAKKVDNVPGFIKRDDSWVDDVMKGVHKSPFSRIKSIFADITADEARAKGYIKGNQKVEEFFSLMKRITTPTTVYKKQKFDRDDIIDIVDFDVIAWVKTEMRMMLEEEIARAVLVGDGRSASSNDKINEQNIRPIWTDEDVFTVKATVNVADDATEEEKAKAFIKATIRSRKNYKGSGNPIMFMSEDMLTNCLLIEDMNGRVIYDTVEKLTTALRVKKIVTVPVMENLTREVGANTHTLAGIYVNLSDYNVGADKGGAVSMFDDFDLDYNQQKYLIETRCSGALIKPYSAVALEFVSATE